MENKLKESDLRDYCEAMKKVKKIKSYSVEFIEDKSVKFKAYVREKRLTEKSVLYLFLELYITKNFKGFYLLPTFKLELNEKELIKRLEGTCPRESEENLLELYFDLKRIMVNNGIYEYEKKELEEQQKIGKNREYITKAKRIFGLDKVN